MPSGPSGPGYLMPPGGVGGSGPTTPAGLEYLNANPMAAFSDWLASLGLFGAQSGRGRYTRSRFDDYWNSYKANLAMGDTVERSGQNDPLLNFSGYLRAMQPETEYAQFGPEQRERLGGEASQRSFAPRLRWLTNVA